MASRKVQVANDALVAIGGVVPGGGDGVVGDGGGGGGNRAPCGKTPSGGGWFNRAKTLMAAIINDRRHESWGLVMEYCRHHDMKWPLRRFLSAI